MVEDTKEQIGSAPGHIKVGAREVAMHPAGQPLASNALIKPLVCDERGFAISGGYQLDIGDELFYKYEELKMRNFARALVFLKCGKLVVFQVSRRPRTSVVEAGKRTLGTLRGSFINLVDQSKGKQGGQQGPPRRFSSFYRGGKLAKPRNGSGQSPDDKKSVADSSMTSSSDSGISGEEKASSEAREEKEEEGGIKGMEKKLELPMSHLFDIQYEGDLGFQLTFNIPTGEDKSFKEEDATLDYKQTIVYLRAKTVEQAEKWIKHVLLAAEDQAKYIDMVEEHLRDIEESNVQKIENLLRKSVDLWTLVKGPSHRDSTNARERLAKHLIEMGSENEEEAEFWRSLDSSNTEAAQDTLGRIKENLDPNLL